MPWWQAGKRPFSPHSTGTPSASASWVPPPKIGEHDVIAKHRMAGQRQRRHLFGVVMGFGEENPDMVLQVLGDDGGRVGHGCAVDRLTPQRGEETLARCHVALIPLSHADHHPKTEDAWTIAAGHFTTAIRTWFSSRTAAANLMPLHRDHNRRGKS